MGRRATGWTIVLAWAGCGRIGFDPRSDGGGGGGDDDAPLLACTTPVVGCDDNDPCTFDDVCVYGRCSPGTFDLSSPACVTRDHGILRSVGRISTPVTTANGEMTIVGRTAGFAQPLPNNVGVGDVVQYDVDGDGTFDALASIVKRKSSQVYEVNSMDGFNPVAVTANTHWEIHRAYTSLADALDGVENTLIRAPLRNFDTWTRGTDLVAANAVWAIACYADGIDDTYAYVCNADEPNAITSCPGNIGWRTGPGNYLRIFTPSQALEVGTPQRHHGRWGSGYQRTDAFEVMGGYVRIEGIAQRLDFPFASRNTIIYATGRAGDVRITHAFGWGANAAGSSRVFDIWNGGFSGPSKLKVVIANTIAISDSTTDLNATIFPNTVNADVEIYNTTAIATAGAAFNQVNPDTATCRNCIGIGVGTASGFAGTQWSSLTYSVSRDNSVVTEAMNSIDGITTGVFGSRTVTFADEPGRDYHLANGDVGARGAGIDLSANPSFSFGDDIDQDARVGAWDIGADQVK